MPSAEHPAPVEQAIANCIPVEDVKEHLSCGLCLGPLAHSLVLTCSHLFCGDCLLRRMQQEGINSKQSCPTCNMDLRAVPVRCLAMDKVAATIVPSLSEEQQEQYAKRSKAGLTAADQINKMLWWLTPPGAVAGPLGTAGPAGPSAAGILPAASSVLGAGFPGSSMGLAAAVAAAAAAATPSMLGVLDPKVSPALSAPFPSLPSPHQGPFGAAVPPYGALGAMCGIPPHLQGAAAAPGTAPLFQLAMAAQLAQAQHAAQMQQQLGTAAAAAAAAAGLGAQQHTVAAGGPVLPHMAGLQHMLLGQERGRGATSSMMPTAPAGYQADQQLSSLMASMCQV